MENSDDEDFIISEEESGDSELESEPELESEQKQEQYGLCSVVYRNYGFQQKSKKLPTLPYILRVSNSARQQLCELVANDSTLLEKNVEIKFRDFKENILLRKMNWKSNCPYFLRETTPSSTVELRAVWAKFVYQFWWKHLLWSPKSSARVSFAVQRIPDKGLGLVATETIELRYGDYLCNSCGVFGILVCLENKEFEELMALNHPSLFDNGIKRMKSGKVHQRGVLIGPLELVNHSCMSPLGFRIKEEIFDFSKFDSVFKPRIFRLDVAYLPQIRTKKPFVVNKGEELLINYFPRQSKETAKPFVCNCTGCKK